MRASVNVGGAPTPDVAVTSGARVRIYDPSVGEEQRWYFNDHTFVHGRGAWHLYGITHPEPGAPLDETIFGHATARSLTQSPWVKEPHALAATRADTGPGEKGENHIWAPHVVEDAGTYYMFYAGGVVGDGATERYKIQLATSRDLFTWTRHPANPLFEDGFEGRDPMVLRVGDHWVMYYTATLAPNGGNHVVACRTSTDLVAWGSRRVAFVHPKQGREAGPTESPFVVERANAWYLFVCCGEGEDYAGEYTSTAVYRSSDPMHFAYEDRVGMLGNVHGGEVVRDVDDRWYISSAGWGQGGVYLAPLEWADESVEP